MASYDIEDLPKFLPVDEKFETKAIHVAYNPIDNPTRAVVPPLTLSSTFHLSDISKQPVRQPQYISCHSDYAIIVQI